MKININYPQLAAEFVIVFVGVAVALAADSLREDLQERKLESEYLGRLYEELRTGYSNLEYQQGEITNAYEAASTLIDTLESDTSHINENNIIDLYIQSARFIPSPDQLQHDTTYLELLSTGRFNLIREADIRDRLARYYRILDNLSFIREAVPRTIFSKFQEATGTAPWSVNNWEDIPALRRERLLNGLRDNSVFLGELLRYKSSMEPLIFGGANNLGRYNRQLNANTELQELLN